MKIVIMNKEVKKMDMYQKRRIRAEKKNSNQEEKLTKVGINWLITIYPRIGENSDKINDCKI